MWYLHIQGESIGPMPAQAILTMLKQKRVEHYEFAWSEGLERWIRLSEISEFNSELPSYPAVSPPAPAPKVETRGEAPARAAREVEPQAAPPAQAWPKVRRAVRVPIHGRVDTEKEGSFEALNLSEGGVFVHAEVALPVGSELRFKLTLNGIDKALEMTGVVIRQGQGEGLPGFAIEFTRLNPAHKRIILEMITKSHQAQQK